ncbi:hypothetical protein [Streptomyces sp. NPDC001410]|uniref:hypothetical protein n=1 Tax=Streptomyces sp. NPDC001410 TaxID=3364574 RepID=UPI0036CC581F
MVESIPVLVERFLARDQRLTEALSRLVGPHQNDDLSDGYWPSVHDGLGVLGELSATRIERGEVLVVDEAQAGEEFEYRLAVGSGLALRTPLSLNEVHVRVGSVHDGNGVDALVRMSIDDGGGRFLRTEAGHNPHGLCGQGPGEQAVVVILP